ncbi:MAG: TIGR00266 family protein [Desulfurococcaceae archaeon]
MVEYFIEKGPAYAILKLKLSPGESITLEPGAYILHKGDIEVKTSSGGVMKGLARAMLGGESLFLNTLIAKSSAEIWATPSSPGDIRAVELRGQELFIQDTSYLAHYGDIELTVGWRGLKGLLAEGQLVWLKAYGNGVVFINSYGAIEEVNLGPGERITVDNNHFVAMDSSVKWRARKFGGLKTFILGGEGIVFDVEGPGKIWIQTRTLPALAQLLQRFLKQSK